MRFLDMSLEKFNDLKTLELPSDIFNNEAKMYVFDDDGNRCLLKKLRKNVGTSFSNKLYTVNELVDGRDLINIDELVFPDKLIGVNNEIVGFSMPFIDNINFYTVLNSNEFTVKQKIDFFKEIGLILEKMKYVRDNTSLEDFYLNDIHENNFILNLQTGRINVVDLDSCKINYNLSFASRYLSFLYPINNVSKYKKSSDLFSIGGLFEVNQDTDCYCYMIMILNYLFGSRMTSLDIDEYYNYLSYLKEIGVSNEVVDMFYLIYTDKSNVNPYECLDEFVGLVDKTNYKSYRLRREK